MTDYKLINAELFFIKNIKIFLTVYTNRHEVLYDKLVSYTE